MGKQAMVLSRNQKGLNEPGWYYSGDHRTYQYFRFMDLQKYESAAITS
jgi:hypothetical protein